MGKIVFWLVVVFALLFAVRMINVAKMRARKRGERAKAKDAPQAMVQCAVCGVFLPAPDARRVGDTWRCTDPVCLGTHTR